MIRILYTKQDGEIIHRQVVCPLHAPVISPVLSELAPQFDELGVHEVMLDVDARPGAHRVEIEDGDVRILRKEDGAGRPVSLRQLALARYHDRRRREIPRLRQGRIELIEHKEEFTVTSPYPGAVAANLSVVVTCHNYGEYLGECLQSILSDREAIPHEIVVVHDGCDDSCQADPSSPTCRLDPIGATILRSGFCNVAAARNFGAEHTEGSILLFVDADNRLAPGYISKILAPLNDPRVVVSYPSIKKFGEKEELLTAPKFSFDAFTEANYIDTCSAVRREVFDEVGGFAATRKTLRDYDFFWKVLKRGYRAAPSGAVLEYRVHGDQLSQHRGPADHANVLLDNADVLVVTLCDGKTEGLREHCRSIWDMTYCHDRMHILFIQNDPSDAVGEILRDTCHDFSQEFASVQYLSSFGAPVDRSKHLYSPEVAQRVASLYHQAVQHLGNCQFMLAYENDVIAPPDTITRLMEAMGPKVAAVSALVNSRRDFKPMAWNFDSLNPPRLDWDQHACDAKLPSQTPIEVGAVSFSCTLIRASVLHKTRIRSCKPLQAHDGIFGWDCHNLGYKVLFHPGVVCKHLVGEGKYV